MHKYRFLATLIIAAMLAVGCDSSSTTAPDQETVSGLRGTILHDNGKPFVGLTVKLKARNQTTKTDVNGRWVIPTSSSSSVAGRALGALDSVVVSTDSQVVTTQPVSSYDAVLPDLYIVQRDLYGSLANFREGTYTVTAYLTFPDSTTKVIPLWHNTVAHAFSGFIYTVYTAQTVDYSVRVIVREDSAITGLSPVVPFNSTAGDVTIPVFSYRNITPTVALSVSGVVRIDNEVTITATVGDTDVVNGYMISDNTKNSIFWKHVTVGGVEGSVGGNTTSSSEGWVLGSKTLAVKIDASVLRDSCYAVKVVDDQDSLVTESQYCFDLSEDLRSTSVYIETRSIKLFQFMSQDSVVADTVSSVGWGWYDSIKNGNKYVGAGRINLNDTLDLSIPDKINRIIARVSYYEWVDSNGILVKRSVVKMDTTSTTKKSLSYVRIDSTGLAGSACVKMVIWSEKANAITVFGDTVALKAGDNKVIVSKVLTDTSSIALRLVPNAVRYNIRGYKNIDDFVKYGNYLYGKYTLADLPNGTYANGLLKLDNSDANDGKFVIKSLVGYK